jgi:hypothetical protein
MVEPGYYNESVVVKDKECIAIVSTALSRRGVAITGDAGSNVLSIEGSTVHLSGIVIRSDGRMRGIWARDSSVSLQECVVACNRISSQVASGEIRGGIACGESSSAVGAGMACWNSSVRIQKTAVIGNIVDDMVERSEFRVQASACSNSTNSLDSGSDALGGGLYFDRCRVEIAGCTIQANAVHSVVAARGGGIWCCNTTMRMWRSRVTDNTLRGPVCEGGGILFKDAAGCELGGSVITGNGFPEGKGGGIFIEGDPGAVSIHRNTAVKLNFPDDVHSDMRQVQARLI